MEWLQKKTIDFESLTSDHLARYAHYLATSQPLLKASSAIQALSVANRYIAWAVADGSAPTEIQCESPAALYKSAAARQDILPQTVNETLRFIRQQDAQQFLHAIETEEISGDFGLRNRLIARLMLDSGLRVSEAVNFPVSSCPPLRECKGPNIVSVVGKGGKQRFVIIPWDLQKELMDYQEIERDQLLETGKKRSSPRALFLGAHRKQISTGQMQKLFRATSAKTGIKATPHMLRHTYATFEYLKFKDLVKLQKVLGHSDSDITERYVGLAALAEASANYEKYLRGLENP